MGKPRVLFITEKWCDCNPAAGPTNSEHNLFGSLESTGLADFTRIHPDEQFLGGGSCEKAVRESIWNRRPDVIVVTIVQNVSYNLDRTTLEEIKKTGIPIVMIWWDTIWPWQRELVKSFSDVATLHVVVDSTRSFNGETGSYLPIWVPQDPGLFYSTRNPRDIDVSLLGSFHGRPERVRAVIRMEQAGINICHGGGQREKRLLPEAYANVLRRSKIVLNFGSDGGRIPLSQSKSRIFEATHCGALLIDDMNPETAFYFNHGTEYIAVEESNLVDQVRYYLSENAGLRIAIAAAGNVRASERYTAERWWRTVFSRIGLLHA